jgi:asparagine synthase (glutamine-hydrolysing)
VFRYLALIWNPADEHAGLAALSLARQVEQGATQWSRSLDSPGLVVFCAGRHNGSSDTTPLAHSAGVVLGRVFTRTLETPESAAHVKFNEAESSQVVASGGRRLLERNWGRYVAIVRNELTSEVWVLRDPSGAFPCWLTGCEGVHIVCSDIEDCQGLRELSFTVNWSYIASFVAHAGLQIRATALNEVSEVQPGERLRFARGSLERSMEWDPIRIARSAPLDSHEDALAALRATTVGCVHTWAACYDGILHNLSGGLDSSIVLACLVSAPSRPRLTCLNYFSTGPYEDERRYARAMARHAGVALVEHQLDPKAVRLQELLQLRRTPRPWFYLYEIEHGRFENELAGQYGADSLFSGAGGDSVFFQARPDLAVTDYLLDHGFGVGVLHTAVDAARVSRRSIWPLLAQAVWARLFGARWDPVSMAKPLTRTVVNSEVIAAAQRDEALAHAWLVPAVTRGAPPGIMWQVLSISTPPAYYSSFVPGPSPERTMPLLSQPLVELCLRIPTYLLIKGGRDRALARGAFARDLPTEIIRRQAKGRADQYMRNILDANLEFVRELLLDGMLVRRGILNRSALETYLTRERSPADYQYSEILQEHACTEAWLRSWLTTTSATAG